MPTAARRCHRSGHRAAVRRTESGYHPPCAVYARETHTTVTNDQSEGLLDAKGLLRELDVCELTDSNWARFGHPAKLLANVNTPTEYGAIERCILS